MKTMFKAIASFFSGFWRGLSLLRVIVGNLLFLVLVIFLLSILFYSSEKDFPDEAALMLSLQGDIVIQKTDTLVTGQLLGQETKAETLLKDIIDVIEHARGDRRIKALVLDLRNMGAAGTSKLQDIGEALKNFKNDGKEIFVAGNYYNQNQYYLAAHADHVYLHPMGGVFLNGYGIYRKFFKSALEKLMIQFHVFRVGSYKSALEPFLRDDMSEYAKEANLAWLTVLWDAYKKNIAEQRELKPDSIDEFINNMSEHLARAKGDSAQLALDYGLVDALKTSDEFRQGLMDRVGQDDDQKTFKQIQFDEYLAAIQPRRLQTRKDSSKVGVIVAKGLILDGTQPAGRIGGDTLADLIRQVRQNDEIKALVLRIDSPGGSVLASEIIRREVELTRQSGKPVVVSMSSVAASGGYWIASAANEIWAAPTTITGSIGIWGAWITVDKSLNSFGIYNDGVGTTQLADAYDPTRPLNSIVADSMQQIIENNYRRFIELVSEGRNLARQDVEKIAQGRVWAGKTAMELGLVDKFGNLQDAVQSAASIADLKDYDVIYVEQILTAREKWIKRLNRFLAGVFDNILGHITHPAARFYLNFGPKLEHIMQLNDPQGVYAYCMMVNGL
ncbi:MAG: signal peptide peptidase SppA [Desulfobacterales bacterium]|nr:signal peptide peptidase SppA [Desulfobacterales bacterium]